MPDLGWRLGLSGSQPTIYILESEHCGRDLQSMLNTHPLQHFNDE
jgi:hypothetical protein